MYTYIYSIYLYLYTDDGCIGVTIDVERSLNSIDINVIPSSLGLKHLLVMMFGNKKPRITQ